MSVQILPGTQVEVVASDRAAELSVTGVVAMPLALDWGDKLTIINQGDSTKVSLGYDIADEKLKCVNEVMNGAGKLYLYRTNNSGVKASGTLATGITTTAKYSGVRGNDISVVIAASGANWKITTMLGTTEMDSQIVSDASKFVANDFIGITGTGTLTAATVKLTGGTNVDDTGAMDAFKAEMEKHEFNVLTYTGTDSAVVSDLISWTDKQRQKNNRIQFVEQPVASDDPAVYHSTSPGTTENYSLTAAEACATVAGILAKQGVAGSLTHYNSITGWTDAEHLTYEQQEARTQVGELLMIMLYGVPTVLYDINSLVTFTDTQPKDFHKGLIMRTLDKYAVDMQKLLDTKCIGKIRRSVNGKSQIKAMAAKMTTDSYLKPGYIENFTADDITIANGSDTDDIAVDAWIQVVDTVDKIHLRVISQAAA